MKWLTAGSLLIILMLSGLAVACGDDEAAPEAPTQAPTTAPEETEEPQFQDVSILNVLGVETPDYTNLMDWAAQEILAERGIDMDVRAGFSREIAFQQVVQGRAEITAGNIINMIPAVAAGAELKGFSNHSEQTWSYASTPDITNIDQLAGKRFGVHSEVSYTKSVTDALIEKYDLQDIDILIVPGSDVRLQALIQGELDATTVDLADLIRVRRENPDAVNVLSTVSEEFPGLPYTTIVFHNSWVQENHDIALAVVTAYIQAAKRLNSDLDYAQSLAAEHFPEEDPAVREEIVAATYELGIWNACDVSTDDVTRVMDFLFTYGQLEEDPSTLDPNVFFSRELLDESGECS